MIVTCLLVRAAAIAGAYVAMERGSSLAVSMILIVMAAVVMWTYLSHTPGQQAMFSGRPVRWNHLRPLHVVAYTGSALIAHKQPTAATAILAVDWLVSCADAWLRHRMV